MLDIQPLQKGKSGVDRAAVALRGCHPLSMLIADTN
jgi:hypothetical protein